jgi:hypothetical protein
VKINRIIFIVVVTAVLIVAVLSLTVVNELANSKLK